jgi:hypothetical protein
MKTLLIACLVAVLALTACVTTTPPPIESAYNVKFLFALEHGRVYSFTDGGEKLYIFVPGR